MGFAVAIEEEGQTREVPFDTGELTIGRGPDNAIVIADPRSSRHHCRLARTPQGVLLEDLRSRNGTLLGGTPVEKALIQVGAQFAIGNVRFRLLDVDGDARPAAPAAASRPPAAALPAAAPAATTVTRLATGGPARPPAKPRAAARPPLALERLEDSRVAERIVVTSFPFVLGRGKDCDLTLADKRCSNHHARIVDINGRLHVEDMQSTNGTILGNRVITRAPLAHGAVLAVGDTQLRIALGGEAARPGAAEPGGAAEDVIAFDAERFLAAERSQHPLAVIALVAILLVFGYFVVDVTRRLVRYENPDPAGEGNLITENWSFEAPRPRQGQASGPIAGWSIVDGDDGVVALTNEHAQPPGRSAVRVESRGAMCRVAPASLVGVTSGASYRLDAYVINLNAFAAGILIEWLVPSTEGESIVGRSFTETARQAGDAIDASGTFTAPSRATSARVCLLVLGAGGSAVFDRVAFVDPAEAAPAGAAGAPEDGDDPAAPARRVAAGKADDPLAVTLGSAGTFTVERKGKRIWVEVWGGLARSADPHGFGPRLATIRHGEGDAASFTGEVGDAARGAWYTLEARAVVSRAELEIGWRLAASDGAAVPLVIYFEARDGAVPVEAVAQGAKVALPESQAESVPAVDELVAGVRDERVGVRFARPVAVSRVEHPFDPSRRVWAVQDGSEAIAFKVGTGSSHEASLAQAAMAQAEEAFGAGRVAEALAQLDEIKTKFPEDGSYALRAAERAAEWRQSAEGDLAELGRELAAYRQTPAPGVGKVLIERARAMASRWQGTPEGGQAASVAQDAEKAAAEGSARGIQGELRAAIELGRKHVAAGETWLAELHFAWVVSQDKDGVLGREASQSLRLIEARRGGERRRGAP